jgi:hypothetical protein
MAAQKLNKPASPLEPLIGAFIIPPFAFSFICSLALNFRPLRAASLAAYGRDINPTDPTVIFKIAITQFFPQTVWSCPRQTGHAWRVE